MMLALILVEMDSSVTNLTSLKHKDCLIDTLACINCLEISKYFIGESSIFILQLGVNNMLKINAFTCATYISNY
jgi:hypothetical protein